MIVYRIKKLATPSTYVAQVTIIDLRSSDVITWLRTQDDLRTLTDYGTEPRNIKLVHGTTRAWFDEMIKPSNELDLHTYFDPQTPDSHASAMLDNYKAS